MKKNNNKPKICLIGRGYPHLKKPAYRFPLYDKLIKKNNADIILFEREEISEKDKEKIPKKYRYEKFNKSPFYTEGIPLRLIKILKKEKYDIVIAMETTSSIALICALMKKILGFKLIIFSELWFYPTKLKAKIALPTLKWIVRQADCYIATWKKAKEKFFELGARKNIFIAPDSANDLSLIKIDKKKLRQIKNRYTKDNKHIILYMGRYVKYKGLDYLIRAFARLEKERKDVLLLAIGEGNFGKECKMLAKKLNVKNIIFQSWIPHKDVVYYYLASDVFVLPARFDYTSMCPAEAWGMTVHEAMSLKKPVIATTAVASAIASITNRVDGFIVKEKSVEQLYKTLKKVVGNDNLINEIGIKAQKKVKYEFSPEIMYQGFEKAIKYANEKNKKIQNQ